MIMIHLDIVHSYHLQKNLGGLAQKWASYGNFGAATQNFFEICLSARSAIRLKIWIGIHGSIFGQYAPFFFASYTSQLFGGLNFGALSAPQAENLGGPKNVGSDVAKNRVKV